jgi:hypothetical protein
MDALCERNGMPLKKLVTSSLAAFVGLPIYRQVSREDWIPGYIIQFPHVYWPSMNIIRGTATEDGFKYDKFTIEVSPIRLDLASLVNPRRRWFDPRRFSRFPVRLIAPPKPVHCSEIVFQMSFIDKRGGEHSLLLKAENSSRIQATRLIRDVYEVKQARVDRLVFIPSDRNEKFSFKTEIFEI